jgi:hypothetical protein
MGRALRPQNKEKNQKEKIKEGRKKQSPIQPCFIQ